MNELTPAYIADVIERCEELEHKDGVNPGDWKKVNPKLLVVADFAINYCDNVNLPILVTSVIRPKIKGVSKTDIHSDGRAFDLSVKGWSHADIKSFVSAINNGLNVGAYSKSDGLEREAIFEDGVTAGKGAHLHLQVRR